MAIRKHGTNLTMALAVTTAAAIFAGCGGVDPDAQALAENGSDVSDVTARVSSLAASFALGTGSTLDVAALVATAALYTPQSCATAVASSDSVTLTFKDCAGPWGLSHLSGRVSVEPQVKMEAPPPPAQGLRVRTNDLSVDRATVTFDSTATITTSDSTRTLNWNPTMRGRTARGRTFETDGAWVLEWQLGGTCIDVRDRKAAFQANVAGSALVAQVISLTRCNANCPTAGTLDVSNGPSLSDTLSFNGSDVAAFTTSSGTNDIQLACGL